jgi:hypothetical protein
MSLQSQVIGILRGPIVQRMRFTFPSSGRTITIAPQTFAVVAAAIDSGRIAVARPTDLAPNVDAQYNIYPRTKGDGTVVPARTLELQSALGRYSEGVVLHECLHAAYQLLGTPIIAADNEASAYVVDALYFRMSGLGKGKWSGGGDTTAGLVADTLLAQYQRGSAGIPSVGLREWNLLKAVIITTPTYMFPWLAKNPTDFTAGPVATGKPY